MKRTSIINAFFFRRIRITFIFTGLLTFWEKQSKLQKKVKETYLHIQLLPFYPLYTSTLLHLKGKYCTSNSTTFVWQLQLSVTFQITVFLTLPVKEKTFISEFDFIFHFSDILKDKLFLYFFRKFSCVLRQTNSSFVWLALFLNSWKVDFLEIGCGCNRQRCHRYMMNL